MKTLQTKTERVFSVSEFLDFLNNILIPQQAVIQGEIGKKIDCRPTYSIFNLLDKKDHTVLKCFCWQDKLENLGIELREGLEIQVLGHPKIYKSQYGSNFEFEAEQVLLVGEGVLKEAFDALKRKLDKEGLFSLDHKRPLPRFCQKIGLVTSKYGKGAKPDFEKHLGKFGFEVYFYDVRVEGIFAVNEIVQALYWFNEHMSDLDVVVLIRGGGSWESLQAFNSEEVARAIFASKIPIMCGIGHESDITIADLVSDVRASTPTDAAKILNENWKIASINILEIEKNLSTLFKKVLENISQNFDFFEDYFKRTVKKEIFTVKTGLESLIKNLDFNFQNYFKEFDILSKGFKDNFLKIERLIKNQREETNKIQSDLQKNKDWWYQKIESFLKAERAKIVLSSPYFRLKQGYTITLDEQGKSIKNSEKLKIDQTIKTKFYKGQTLSRVKKIES